MTARSSRRFLLASIGVPLSALVLLFGPELVGGRSFCVEDLSFQRAYRFLMAEAFREGRLPLWSFGYQGGYPLLAEGQIGALHPIHLGL